MPPQRNASFSLKAADEFIAFLERHSFDTEIIEGVLGRIFALCDDIEIARKPTGLSPYYTHSFQCGQDPVANVRIIFEASDKELLIVSCTTIPF